MCAGRCREPRRKGTWVADLSGCVVPWAARASCWPQPQQLLPVSAAGSGRRCCTGAFLPAGLFGGSYELRLPLFPQPLGRALKKRSAAPASPPCFRRRRRSAPLLFESTRSISLISSQNKNLSVLYMLRLFGGRGWITRAALLKTAHWAVFTLSSATAPQLFESTRPMSLALLQNKNLSVLYTLRFFGGRGWIRTTEAESSRFTVCPHWPLGNTPIFIFAVVWTACICYH